MRSSQTVNKYAHLEYKTLHELDISINEYWFLDMVYQLSRDGWCYKSLQNIAHDMKLSRSGVIKMRDRLISRKLLKKNIRGHLKTEVAYHSVYHLDKATYHSVTSRVTKYSSTGTLSSHKNNIETNKEKVRNNKGYKKALAMRQALTSRLTA